MLDSIFIENFRSLRKVSVALKPLTALIGQNDTGKSTFLDALEQLAEPRSHTSENDHWRLDSRNVVVLESGNRRIEAGPKEHSVQLRRGGGWERAPSKDAVQKIQTGFYRLPAQGVPMISEGLPDESGPPILGPQGERVPALLDYFLRRDRPRFFDCVDAMKRLIPGMEELEIATPDAQRRRVVLVVEDGLRIPADRASTGVRMLIFFIALAYHPSPPELILLEEPDSGVHPRRLADIMGLLREITRGTHGDRAAQVVLTTHSPYLLDLVEFPQDQVLVFRRNDDGSRTAEPADASRLRTFLEEFQLGEVWYNQGETGLVSKGNP
jgi:predicted ATPase